MQITGSFVRFKVGINFFAGPQSGVEKISTPESIRAALTRFEIFGRSDAAILRCISSGARSWLRIDGRNSGRVSKRAGCEVKESMYFQDFVDSEELERAFSIVEIANRDI